MAIELYNHKNHVCLMFAHLSDEGGEAVQANQFLIVDEQQGAIIDPGGNVAYNELLLNINRFFPPNKLTEILASHADPDIIASLDRWMTSTQATLYISRLWERFAPHFCKPGKTAGRIVGIPDAGMRIPLGRSEIVALPAHFMHAEGNFQFWDPVSRILFSGDLGCVAGHFGRRRQTHHLAGAKPTPHGGFSPPLHGLAKGIEAVGPHGPPTAAHPHDRAAARCATDRPGGARIHRLDRDPELRHRPPDASGLRHTQVSVASTLHLPALCVSALGLSSLDVSGC